MTPRVPSAASWLGARFSENWIKITAQAIARAAGDEEWRDRVKAAEDAAKAYHDGGHAYGVPHLIEIFGKPATKRIIDWLNYNPGPESEAKATAGTTGMSLENFFAHAPMHSYIFAPTRDLWPAASVNSRLPPIIGPDNKPISPAKWLDCNRSVAQMTWLPGAPMLLENRLIAEGGFIDFDGLATFNLYRFPIIKPGNANQAAP
jgi:hypothetical protein